MPALIDEFIPGPAAGEIPAERLELVEDRINCEIFI